MVAVQCGMASLNRPNLPRYGNPVLKWLDHSRLEFARGNARIAITLDAAKREEESGRPQRSILGFVSCI